jgi:hypothetical protein
MRAKSFLSLTTGLVASLFAFGHADAKTAPVPAAHSAAVPAWLTLRIQHNFATEEEIAFHRALVEGSSTEPYQRLADETTVCPGCQSSSICPDNCTGGCQSSETGGCKSSCLLSGLNSDKDDDGD